MKDTNIVVIVGRLTDDPDIKMTTDGKKVAAFNIANNRGKNQDGSEKKASFFKVNAWEGLADIVKEHLSKGRKILVVGEFVQKSYLRQADGKLIYYYVLEARQITFLDKEKRSEETGSGV